MFTIYLSLLLACTAVLLVLILRRVLGLLRRPRPARGRLLNEWAWTVIPLLVLLALLWRALRVAQ